MSPLLIKSVPHNFMMSSNKETVFVAQEDLICTHFVKVVDQKRLSSLELIY